MLVIREYRDTSGRTVYVLELKTEGLKYTRYFADAGPVDRSSLEPVEDGFEINAKV